MKSLLASVALATAVTLSASAASAAPFAGGVGKAAGASDAGIVKVHGLHRECLEGPRGWHRSTPWGGRIVCTPPWQKWRGQHDHRGHGGDDRFDRGHGKHVEPRHDYKPSPRVEVKPAPRHGQRYSY